MNNNLGIAFSGGCFSGKSSSIEKLKELLGEENCIVLGEVMRDQKIRSIDDIRKYPKVYLGLQSKIILQKIKQELEAFKLNDNKIILIDRALSDSLFYLTFYLDKSQLNTDQLKELAQLYNLVFENAYSSFHERYDLVLNFLPIDSECTDKKFRPDNIKILKEVEHNIINTFTKGIAKDNTYIYNQLIDIDLNLEKLVEKLFLSRFKKFPDNYDEYSANILGFYLLDNTYSNVSNSVLLEKMENEFDDILMSALLFTNDKKIDLIFDLVNKLQISEEFLNSRCYPTGYFKQGNIMIVGEAPGRSGRAINSNWLKPSFIFERTSFILRSAINNALEIEKDFTHVPYITNLCKYAVKDNLTAINDFNFCYDILEKEILMLQPKKIIALGNKTYDYLKYKRLDKIYNIVKLMHPSVTIYSGITQKEYNQQFMQVL